MNDKDKMDAALDRIFAYGPSKKEVVVKQKKSGATEVKSPLKRGQDKSK